MKYILRRERYDCPKCGQDKGFLISKKIKGVSPADRPCKVCRSVIISAKLKGRVAWNKGIPLSEQTKEKLRKINTGKHSITKGTHLPYGRKVKLSCINRGISIENFDGFTTPINDAERVKLKKTDIRQRCFNLADFTCMVCKTKGAVLNAHHLYSWANFPELRFEITNLVCLCAKCHKKFHTQYGSKNNTKLQFEDFMKGLNNE